MMIDCKKAGQLIDQKDAAEKLGWWSRRKLKIHLVFCKMCNGYHDESRVVCKIIRMVGVRNAHQCLSENEKSEIKRNISEHR